VKHKKERMILADVMVTDYAAEGKSLARLDGKVIFISGAVPGDVADIILTKNKKDWAEGRVKEIKQFSAERVSPFCKHFGVCGGCKWQMLPYHKQLEYKQQEATQNLRRIGKMDLPEILPIIGGENTMYYRNKLEFTFSNKRYLTGFDMAEATLNPRQAGLSVQASGGETSKNTSEGETLNFEVLNHPLGPARTNRSDGDGGNSGALGYHAPRLFDKVIEIEECFLMDEVNNKIRNTIRDFALQNKYSYYDFRLHTGWLRNIVVRLSSTNELMVNLVINYEDEPERIKLLDHILKEIPSITTLLYTVNPKWNDSIYDLYPQVYFGKGFIMEKLKAGPNGEAFHFKISPKSFFQTNTRQAEQLYSVTRDFAGLTGNEIVYDLYCGTGSIGIFLSKGAKKIIGVEVIEEAILDARENAALNKIEHSLFFAGDVIKICNDDFFSKHGHPDIIISDPPRAGMHEKLVEKLLEIAAPKIVYVSCNTATQARDLALLSEKYSVQKIQPVDMFPHTHHIECVVLLSLK
jgi:23S rRNA (uracil1939-C5)-methyltransferase